MRAFRPPSRLFSGLCFLAPPAAAATLLALAPLAALLAGDAGPQAPPLHWEGRLWSILFRSAGLALFAGAGAGALGLGLALWIASRRGPWARGVRGLCFLPLLLPPYLFALTSLLLSLPYGFLASACILGLVLAPLGAWTSLNALRRMDRDALEAGLLMGGGGATWRRVVLPAALPSALAGATLAFALALVEYGVPALMQCSTLSVEIAADFSQYGSPSRALILALPLALPAGALAAAAARSRGFLNGGTRETGGDLLAATPLPAGLAAWAWLALGAWLATLMVPAAALAAALAGGRPAGAGAGAALPAAGLSWAVALGASLLALTLAAPLAWRARRGGFRPLVAIWAFLLAVPAPLFGIGALTLWTRIAAGHDWAGLPLVLAHAGRFLPLAGLALAVRFRQADPLPWEAARLVPARAPSRFTRVFLPLHGSDLFAAAAFAAALSFGDVAVSLLLCPPGSQTLALRLFTLLHYGAGAEVALQSLMSLACGASAVALLALLLRRRRA